MTGICLELYEHKRASILDLTDSTQGKYFRVDDI